MAPDESGYGVHDGIYTIVDTSDETLMAASLPMQLVRDARDRIEAKMQAASQRVYTQRDLLRTLEQDLPEWGIQIPPPPHQFLRFLLAKTSLNRVSIESPNGYRRLTRYTWGRASAHDIAASMGKGVYFCHESAMQVHGLLAAPPQTLYVNREQTLKPAYGNSLTQESITRAFTRPQRTSNYAFSFEGRTITVLSGKHTKRHGVIEMMGPEGRSLAVTNLERTLVDIAVRPSYAGGIKAVLAAFMAASDSLSVQELVATLKKLDYVYPYHQAIGFLLQRAGMNETKLQPLKDEGMDFDFFLVHGSRRLRYDSEWRIHYPSNL